MGRCREGSGNENEGAVSGKREVQGFVMKDWLDADGCKTNGGCSNGGHGTIGGRVTGGAKGE